MTIDEENVAAVEQAIAELLKEQDGLIKGIRKTVAGNVVVLIQKSTAIAHEIAKWLSAQSGPLDQPLRDVAFAIMQGSQDGFLVTSMPSELVRSMFDALGTPMDVRLSFGVIPRPVVIFGWGRTAICSGEESIGKA